MVSSAESFSKPCFFKDLLAKVRLMWSEVGESTSELVELVNRVNFLRIALNLVIRLVVALFVLWVFLYVVSFALGSEALSLAIKLLGYSVVALTAVGIVDAMFYDRALNKLVRATLKPTSDATTTLADLVALGLDESFIADYRESG